MTDLEKELQVLNGLDLSAANNQPVQQPAQQPMQQAPVQQPYQGVPTEAPVMPNQVYQQPVQAPVQQPVYQQPMQSAPMQPVQQPVYQQPIQQAPVQNVAPAQPTLNLDVAQQETDGMSYVTVEMGKKISTAVMDKFKGQKDEKKRVIIMMPFADIRGKENAAYAIKRHYSEEMGSFVCFNGECCQYESRADVRYLFPVMEIPIINGDVTKPIPANIGGQLKLKLLVAGGEMYSNLCDVYTAHNNSFEGYDLIMTCTEQQYQSFTVQPTMSTFRDQYPADYKACVDRWKMVRDQAYTVVARKMDRDYYTRQKGLNYTGQTTGGTNVPDMNTTIGIQ